MNANYAVTILRGALVKAEYAIKGREHTGFITKALEATAAFTSLAAAAQPEQAKPTDISERLRKYAIGHFDGGHSYEKLMLAAADEIERYYGGMLAWKQTAEAKDAAPAIQAQPLTDAKIEYFADCCTWNDIEYTYDEQIRFARMIERHLTATHGDKPAGE